MHCLTAAGRRRGTSLLEVLVVVTILGVLLTLCVPSYRRAVEQSRAEIAAANLRAIWAAQRLYWLEHRTFAASLVDLGDLLDPSITVSSSPYVYGVNSVSGSTFTATAIRSGSSRWTGQFTIDQTGMVSGTIQATGEVDIVPGAQ